MHAVAAVLAGLACCVAAPKAPTPPPFTAFVRVNQVGYPAAASKRAYLMSSASAAGSAFSIRNESGAVVYSGTVGASLGAWNATYPFVEPLDFDAFATTGTYTISLGSTTSPGFRIDTGQNVYATPLANGLFFYQSERDGPNFIPNALRTAPGHVNDTSAMTYVTPNANSSGHFSGDLQATGTRIDASGGWWDAGDYIKGVETLGYATALLLHGVRDFPTQMGGYSAEARFGTDWLLQMWDDSTRTFYYQV